MVISSGVFLLIQSKVKAIEYQMIPHASYYRLNHRGVHLFRDEVLVFSVKSQSTLVLSKYSVDNGELGSSVSYW